MKLRETSLGEAPQFVPADFSEVVAHLPEGCPLIGGQAVAWWAIQYGIKAEEQGKQIEITSQDIDFWGGRDDLVKLAKALGRKATFPNQYEMSVWAGAIPLKINDQNTLAEFLHSIPGLDTLDPETAAVPQPYESNSVRTALLILTPVSLVLTKLHAVRHFDQKRRRDEQHLRVCIRACRFFIEQLLRQRELRHVFWNCERLIRAHHLKPYSKLESKHDFNILDAVPIEKLRQARSDRSLKEDERKALRNFAEIRWPQILKVTQPD